MTDFSKYQAKTVTPTPGTGTDFSKYGVVSTSTGNPTSSIAGTLLSPTMEGLNGLKTLYGGGEQGIASKILNDVSSGATDIQKGMETGGIAGTPDVLKGVAKTGARVAGDVAGTIYAPIGAAIGATGLNHVFDWIGKVSQMGGKYNILNGITDKKLVQDFVTKHPNAEEDFGRAMNLVLASGEEGKIEPSTVIPRTIEQLKYTQGLVKDTPKILHEATQKVFGNTPEDIVNKRVKELSNINSQYSDIRRNNSFSPDGGEASLKRVASTDVLSDAVDENGVIRTKQPGGAVEQYEAMTLDNAEGVVRKNLVRLGETISPDDLTTILKDKINKNPLIQGKAKTAALNNIDGEVAAYPRDASGKIPLENVHDAKVATYKIVKDFATPAEYKTYQKALGEGLKTAVEDTSSFNVGEVNAELGKYLQDVSYLEKLDGKRVKGGKLGKYFAQISGNIIGGAAGAVVGGPAGSAIGTIVGGEVAGRIKGSALQRTLKGEAGLETPKSPIIEKAVQTGNSPRLALPAPAEGTPRIQMGSGPTINLGSRSQSLADQIYEYNLGNRNQQYNTANTIIKSAIEPQSIIPKSEVNSAIPKELEPLAQEARKYKSAEEFVKAQPIVYHGSPIELKQFHDKSGVFFTNSMEDASGFGGNPDHVYEGYLNFKKPLVIDAKGAKWDELNTKYGKSTREVIGNAQKDGYDGVVFKNIVDNVADTTDVGGESTIYYAYKPKSAFLNESQLTDFYKKVNKKK